MRSQKRRDVQIIHRLLPRRANIQQIKHLPPDHTLLSPPILTQEALRPSKSFCQLLRSVYLSGIRDISEEEKDLELGVCRTKILKFVWPGVGSSDENLGDYPLADRKTWSEGLVGGVGYRRRSVVDADPRGEPAKGLESPGEPFQL